MQRSVTGGGWVLFAAVALVLSMPAAAEAQALGRLYIEALDAAGQVVPGSSVPVTPIDSRLRGPPLRRV